MDLIINVPRNIVATEEFENWKHKHFPGVTWTMKVMGNNVRLKLKENPEEVDISDPNHLAMKFAHLLQKFPDEKIKGSCWVGDFGDPELISFVPSIDISFQSNRKGSVSNQIVEYHYQDEEETLEEDEYEEATMEGFIKTIVDVRTGKLLQRNVEVKRNTEVDE